MMHLIQQTALSAFLFNDIVPEFRKVDKDLAEKVLVDLNLKEMKTLNTMVRDLEMFKEVSDDAREMFKKSAKQEGLSKPVKKFLEDLATNKYFGIRGRCMESQKLLKFITYVFIITQIN